MKEAYTDSQTSLITKKQPATPNLENRLAPRGWEKMCTAHPDVYQEMALKDGPLWRAGKREGRYRL